MSPAPDLNSTTTMPPPAWCDAREHALATTAWLIVGLIVRGSTAWGQTNAVAEAADPIDAVSEAFSTVTSVYSEFVQKKHTDVFERPLLSTGVICFQRPGHIRWETVTPYRSVLLADQQGVAQFEWMDNEWRRLELGHARAMKSVMANLSLIWEGRFGESRKDYAISVATGTVTVVTLTPKSRTVRSFLAGIELHLASDLSATRRVVLREPNGDHTEIELSRQVRNLTFPDRTFDATGPLALEAVQAVLPSE